MNWVVFVRMYPKGAPPPEALPPGTDLEQTVCMYVHGDEAHNEEAAIELVCRNLTMVQLESVTELRITSLSDMYAVKDRPQLTIAPSLAALGLRS